MKLGIDIDGCLNNFQDGIIKIIKRDYGIDIPKNIYYAVDELKFSKEETENFWKKYNPELLSLATVVHGAMDNLNKLKELGCSLNIITARDYSIAKLTEDWLKENKIPYDEIYFNGEKKYQVCKWKNINFMVEDNPQYAKDLADYGIKVALYSQPYNLDFKHNNVNHVNNWDEIYNIISNKVFTEKF